MGGRGRRGNYRGGSTIILQERLNPQFVRDMHDNFGKKTIKKKLHCKKKKKKKKNARYQGRRPPSPLITLRRPCPTTSRDSRRWHMAAQRTHAEVRLQQCDLCVSYAQRYFVHAKMTLETSMLNYSAPVRLFDYDFFPRHHVMLKTRLLLKN